MKIVFEFSFNVFALILVFMTISSTLASQPKIHALPEDVQIFDDYISYIDSWRAESKDLILEKTALFFLGKPYVANTLDQNDSEVLTVNLRELDCFTFVETVIALTLTTMSEEPAFSTFTDKLQSIRYRSKETLEYQSRLHYTTDWIYENEKRGLLKNISGELGGVIDDKVINFMSTHRTAYKQLESNDNLLSEIVTVEDRINERGGFYFLPKEKITKTNLLIPHMSVVAFTTNIEGLDVTHVGFALRESGELKLIHASSVENEVVIDEQSLSNYCNARKSCTGIIIVEVL